MPTKAPSHILPGSSRALRAPSVRAAPEVPGFHPPPFNHVSLVSALRASCSTSRGSRLLPLGARHPLRARCHPALDRGCLGLHVTGRRVPGSQLGPGAGGARRSTSHPLTHIPYTAACIYCTPTVCPALQQTDTPCLRRAPIYLKGLKKRNIATPTAATADSAGGCHRACKASLCWGLSCKPSNRGSCAAMTQRWLAHRVTLGRSAPYLSESQFPHLFGERSCVPASLVYWAHTKALCEQPTVSPPMTSTGPRASLAPRGVTSAISPLPCLSLSGRR